MENGKWKNDDCKVNKYKKEKVNKYFFAPSKK